MCLEDEKGLDVTISNDGEISLVNKNPASIEKANEILNTNNLRTSYPI